MDKVKKPQGKFFATLIIFSLVGQIAWVVENMYFNVFIYDMFGASPSDISLMVALSSVVATVTTLLVGALSDKLGKRKIFISVGYILWGVSILSFALVRENIIGSLFPMATSVAGLCITITIVLDCIMTFFGSSANDACFNAWLTDSTTNKNRGMAEGINSMMPLLAILVVFGGFMFLPKADPLSSNNEGKLPVDVYWPIVFIIIGIVVILIGILGFFIIKDPKINTSENQSYFKNIIYGFKPSVIKSNLKLYVYLALFTVFGISIQIFMPYLIIYYDKGLNMGGSYVFIMAPAVILAAIFTAIWGRKYDKWKFNKSILPSLVLLCLGYVILFSFSHYALVFVGSLLMMCGYLSSNAVFGAVLRDNTPQNKSGMFQGLRIVGQVLIPGIIGPIIGASVLSGASTFYDTDGTERFIPNDNIFIASLVVALLVILLFFLTLCLKNKIGGRNEIAHLLTKEGENLTGEEYNIYPRPQLKRDSFLSLNGKWSLTVNNEKMDINVPYPPESVLSGVNRVFESGSKLSYERKFTLEKDFIKDRVILNLGAVDQMCIVYLNDIEVGIHSGGYNSFSFDITEYLKKENLLKIDCVDTLKDHSSPYGKQSLNRGGMWYTPVSGIWQSVWLESVSNKYIKGLKIDTGCDFCDISFDGITSGTVSVAFENGELSFPIQDGKCHIKIDSPIMWSPESPHLYYFTVEAEGDRIESYFALRTLEIKEIDKIKRICLNGEPYFFNGLLDQGYFSDGIYTPASPDLYRQDVENAKALGFNTLRKHIKIEPEWFYYECDRQGMIVFQDMVNNGKYSFFHDTALPTIGFKNLKEKKRTDSQKSCFISSMKETVKQLYNHPSICYYTIFNEGWGQFESDKMYSLLKSLDSSRIVDTNSGWFGGHASDVESIHVYFKPVCAPKSFEKPLVLSEFGGYSYKEKGHVANENETYGYKFYKDKSEFCKGLFSLYTEQIAPLIKDGLCGAIYTQLTDVEDETNGLITYDRKIIKVEPEKMRELAKSLNI
ncbi:MAG: MFS transporter [Clostridia bacterium]|nr:MFS transporter [Clostridia bacterium]